MTGGRYPITHVNLFGGWHYLHPAIVPLDVAAPSLTALAAPSFAATAAPGRTPPFLLAMMPRFAGSRAYALGSHDFR
jgi:hypothetical protein